MVRQLPDLFRWPCLDGYRSNWFGTWALYCLWWNPNCCALYPARTKPIFNGLKAYILSELILHATSWTHRWSIINIYHELSLLPPLTMSLLGWFHIDNPNDVQMPWDTNALAMLTNLILASRWPWKAFVLCLCFPPYPLYNISYLSKTQNLFFYCHGVWLSVNVTFWWSVWAPLPHVKFYQPSTC